MKVLVIIPAYNESGNILSTVESINKTKIKNIVLDYIVINDNSLDSTKDICIKNNINYIDLPINLGIGGAVQTGYKYAYNNDYDIAIQYDGDHQHDEKYIENLIEELNKGNDIVIGSRFISDLSEFKSTRSRRFAIRFLSYIIKLVSGKKIYDHTSGFRAVNRDIIKLFKEEYPIDYPESETNAMLAVRGYKISEIPVEMNERKHGKSSIHSIKYLYFAIKVPLAIIVTSIIYGGKK